jgi:DNA-binding transcriptional LysR family regulator
VFSDAPGSAEWRFAEDGKAGRKIRISGRLWMNSLDALAAAAKEGAGIVRVPSWQAEADLAAGHLVRLRAGAGAITPDVSAVAAGFAEDQGLRRLPHRALARRRSVQRAARESINRIIVQFLNRAKGLWYTKPLINRVS